MNVCSKHNYAVVYEDDLTDPSREKISVSAKTRTTYQDQSRAGPVQIWSILVQIQYNVKTRVNGETTTYDVLMTR